MFFWVNFWKLPRERRLLSYHALCSEQTKPEAALHMHLIFASFAKKK